MLALPFAASNPAVGSISFSETDWGGKVGVERLNRFTNLFFNVLASVQVDSHLWAEWVDFWLLLLLGGIPWQCYFQRVLSAKTSKVTFFTLCAVFLSTESRVALRQQFTLRE